MEQNIQLPQFAKSFSHTSDRIIIRQAIRRKMILISKDRNFKAYRKFGHAQRRRLRRVLEIACTVKFTIVTACPVAPRVKTGTGRETVLG